MISLLPHFGFSQHGIHKAVKFGTFESHCDVAKCVRSVLAACSGRSNAWFSQQNRKEHALHPSKAVWSSQNQKTRYL